MWPHVALEILKDVWTGAAGQDYAYSLAFDGQYLYVGLQVNPAVICKIDISTMETVDTWTGAAGELTVTSLIFDGTYLVASLGTAPGKVIQIDTSDMSTVAT